MNNNADKESFCWTNQMTTYAYLTSKQIPPLDSQSIDDVM